VACRVGKVCPDWDIMSTLSVPGKNALNALLLPKPRSLLALTVTTLSWGKMVLRSAAHCSAIHRLASMPPINRSVAADKTGNAMRVRLNKPDNQ
jgi:hypothetical protein